MVGNIARHLLLFNVSISEAYRTRLKSLHYALGIPDDYMDKCSLPLFEEALNLVDAEVDFYGRPQRLTKDAFDAWTALKAAAQTDDVIIFLISAFRGIDYQQEVIARKLAEGRHIDEILRVNSAPGYSEHHTGRAIDIGTLGCDPLVEAFENTKAFRWLRTNGNKYGFFMSYPRENQFGINYEPWHWCFKNRDK